jgi:hypothetical protein
MVTIVKPQAHIINVDTLRKCRKGLNNHIKKEKVTSKRNLLKEIKSEIDFLIDNL